MRLADIPAPDTAAARAALELATEYHTPSLLNHVLRSWLWAEGFATVEGLHGIDRELLYVSAVLHDIGIVPAYDNHTLAYEDAGGHVAKALTAGAGWPAARRTRAHEVIVRHNWPEVDPAFDPEGHLLEMATALDISGVRPDALPEEFRREVVTAFPRLALAAEFTACVTDQAERKPDTAARRIVDRGVAGKLLRNPLETLG
ncbi:HD domain-containing protein [Leifsonia shinshuensis]|uniref:Cyanamide hydratase n=1 Tax=Leifsonia shinshuensis TaxID=150026 RepID=A0A7G6Y8Q6_9MICO|nr:HD domain-containing protein [Leifsonia shinshuensis]QNE34871.1 cyanamide hydratase [Leifsonia shinshuensis]